MELEYILRELENSYTQKGYENKWTHEGPKIRTTLEHFLRRYNSLYSLTRALSLGGGGIAIEAAFIPLENERQVLKFPRPVQNDELILNRILAKETEKLRTLRHQNIIHITFKGEIPESGNTPFYAMEYLDGVKDADIYLEGIRDRQQLNSNLIEVVRGSLAGVAYLHDNGIVHLDLKPANLFVDTKGHVLVADFGFAKQFTTSGETNYIGGTDGYMHPDYAKLMSDNNDPNRNMGISALRNELKTTWDLYSLGTTYLKLLDVVNRLDPNGRFDYERQYLRSMAYRMLDGKFHNADLPYGLPREVLLATSYNHIEEVIDNLEKLTGTHNLAVRVPEISRYQKHTIQAASHGPVPFTARVEKIIDSPQVRRLGQLSQLGLVHFIYPTATHSRLEHSLGTFAMVCRYVRSLYNDPFNPLFRQLVTDRDIEALLVAALIHDIGHYPLAHDLEEAHDGIFGHEMRTLEVLRDPASTIHQVISRSHDGALDEFWTTSPEDVINVLDRSNASIKNQILRSCLDGPIDADKLDYLLRDSENLRLPYGRGIDVEKLIQSLTVIAEVRLDKPLAKIGIHERGKIAAESLAFARYAMYGSVYWHHAHRSAKAMLNALAFEAMAKAYDRNPKTNRYIDDIRTSLNDFLTARSADQAQLPFETPKLRDQRYAFLDTGSEGVIEWLDKLGDRKAHGVAEALVRRELFKRAIVVSQMRGSILDWRQIAEVYGTLGEKWRTRHRANLLLQNNIVERLQANRDKSSEISSEVIDQAVAASQDGPAILLDYPPAKSGAHNGATLEYLREGALKYGEVSSGVEDLEQSPVWRSLRNDSRESLAKLRVFCHPKLQASILAILQRQEFEKAIRDSISAAVNETT